MGTLKRDMRTTMWSGMAVIVAVVGIIASIRVLSCISLWAWEETDAELPLGTGLENETSNTGKPSQKNHGRPASVREARPTHRSYWQNAPKRMWRKRLSASTSGREHQKVHSKAVFRLLDVFPC